MPDSSKHSQLIGDNKKIQAVDRFKDVYIKPDQTVMQRELYIRMRQELRERQESSEIQWNSIKNINDRLLDLVLCSTEATCVVQNNEDPLVPIDPHHPELLIQVSNDSVSYKKFPTIDKSRNNSVFHVFPFVVPLHDISLPILPAMVMAAIVVPLSGYPLTPGDITVKCDIGAATRTRLLLVYEQNYEVLQLLPN
ncbi:hypothetical protein JTB14_025782 [Gonioctena quinquepunctata]|nr:hypothetical protein JTB14_025782 [Gonioctena quinquepunctata]